MKPPPVLAILAVSLVVALGGCGETKEYLGIGHKRAPDEFTVFAREPLSLPPDYGLRPPTPGSKQEKTTDARESARNVLIGTTGQLAVGGTADSTDGTLDPGTEAFLAKAGALNTDPEIRSILDQETAMLSNRDQKFTDKVLFWQKDIPFGSVVDPTKEAKRIKEAQSADESAATDETPIIERKPKAWLDGIFN